jgi:hypothetical protein
MKLDYVPLLRVHRRLMGIPRGQAPDYNGLKRFKEYLRTFLSADGKSVELPPLVAINPMAKDHVTVLLDALLALDADGVAARAAAEAEARLADLPGEAKATVVVIDDWLGPWTSRAPVEFGFRMGCRPPPERLPRWMKHFWVMGVLWSSEPATERAAREAMLTAIYRLAYVHRHGPARTLGDMLAQEGHVMATAGCTEPSLDAEDIAYTREVLTPLLDAQDTQTCMACLFGDAAAGALGYTPHGLSPWAGLAVALHDARAETPRKKPGRPKRSGRAY